MIYLSLLNLNSYFAYQNKPVMMLRIFLLVSFWVVSMGFPVKIWSAPLYHRADVVEMLDRQYTGLMDVAMSKGKTFKDRPVTFYMKAGRLCCDLPKVGKMPGKIRIDLPVKVKSDGTLVALPECVAGEMKLPLGICLDLRLISMDHAKVCGDSLTFVLQIYGKMMGTKIPTTIRFRGNAPAGGGG